MTRKPRKQTGRPLTAIFRYPLLIAVLSLVGLVSALVGDGAWDAVSWATLGAAVATMAWFALPRRG